MEITTNFEGCIDLVQRFAAIKRLPHQHYSHKQEYNTKALIISYLALPTDELLANVTKDNLQIATPYVTRDRLWYGA